MERVRGRWNHRWRQADSAGAIKLLRLAVKVEHRDRVARGYYPQPAVDPDKHEPGTREVFDLGKTSTAMEAEGADNKTFYP